MPEVLQVDVDPRASRSLRGPNATLDPATHAVVERAVADAHAAGKREGHREGRAAASQELAELATAVRSAAEAVRTELVAQRQEATRASLDLAGAVATAVLDASPPTEALAVLDRVREAIDLLDDEPLRVKLNPDDHATVIDALGDTDEVELIADPRLARGDATVAGSVAGAELTRQALLTAALDVLGEGAA